MHEQNLSRFSRLIHCLCNDNEAVLIKLCAVRGPGRVLLKPNSLISSQLDLALAGQLGDTMPPGCLGRGLLSVMLEVGVWARSSPLAALTEIHS